MCTHGGLVKYSGKINLKKKIIFNMLFDMGHNTGNHQVLELAFNI